MKIELLEKERLDDLGRKNYKIIQNPDGFCFGMDAVLLSGYAKVKKGQRVLDLGTGTGIIPILLEAKTEASHLTGLEIQEKSADMARRSVRYNDLEDKISIVTGDIKEAGSLFGAASFDVVTSNPPYMIGGHGLQNPSMPKTIARHEVLCDSGGCGQGCVDSFSTGRLFLYGTQTFPTGRDHHSNDKISVRAETDAVLYIHMWIKSPIWC